MAGNIADYFVLVPNLIGTFMAQTLVSFLHLTGVVQGACIDAQTLSNDDHRSIDNQGSNCQVSSPPTPPIMR